MVHQSDEYNHARISHREPCLRCRAGGGDRSGDNLVVYMDGHKHCYACGRHDRVDTWTRLTHEVENTAMPVRVQNTTLEFPMDFMPLGSALFAKAPISWLRRYGINDGEIKKWKLGWSNMRQLLIIPVYVDNEVVMWQGRSFGDGQKYLTQGMKRDILYPVGNDESGVCIMVEDFVSALRVGRQYQAAPLWGSDMSLGLIEKVADTFDVMGVWLDPDKTREAVRIALRASQYIPTFVVVSALDPKDYDSVRIKELVEAAGRETMYKDAPPVDKRAFSEHADPELDQEESMEEKVGKLLKPGEVAHKPLFYDMHGQPIDLDKATPDTDWTQGIEDNPLKGSTHGS